MARARHRWRRWGRRLDIALRLANGFVVAGLFGSLALFALVGWGPVHFITLLWRPCLVIMLILLGLTFPWWLLWLDEDWRLRRARRGSEWRQALAEAASVEVEPSEAELIAARDEAAENVWIAALTIGFLAAFTMIWIVVEHFSPNPRFRFDLRFTVLFPLPAFVIAAIFLLFRLTRYRQRVRALRNVLRGELAR